MKLAPIILFVYNRPWHTRQTVEALLKNELASESDLFIYSDAAAHEQARMQVTEVRDYIKNITGFKKITILERESNVGLADNIIGGVTDIVNSYGKAIVMEDDIVSSSAYLTFMNQALDRYKNEHQVWHISGWNYPIASEGLGDIYFWRVMNCWGWATWSDRWIFYEKNPERLITEWTKKQKKEFDLDNSSIFWSQVEANAVNKINTWAIFWSTTIFEHKGLCLNPVKSYLRNIGHDGSGIHCGKQSFFDAGLLNEKKDIDWNISIDESALALKKIKSYYKRKSKPLYKRILYRLLQWI